MKIEREVGGGGQVFKIPSTPLSTITSECDLHRKGAKADTYVAIYDVDDSHQIVIGAMPEQDPISPP